MQTYYEVLKNGVVWTDYIESIEEAEEHIAECIDKELIMKYDDVEIREMEIK